MATGGDGEVVVYERLGALAVEGGARATSLLLQIMHAQTMEAHHLREQFAIYDERRVRELEEENAMLRRELALMRKRVMWLAYGGLDEYA